MDGRFPVRKRMAKQYVLSLMCVSLRLKILPHPLGKYSEPLSFYTLIPAFSRRAKEIL